MLQPADLVSLILPGSLVAAIIAALILAKVHGLFGTGLSYWLLVITLSMMACALMCCLSAFGDGFQAVADVCIIVAGFSTYAASHWLRRTFEIGGKRGI